MSTLTNLLKEHAEFLFCRDGNLYYETDSGFKFTVPINELGNGTALRTDKAIVFMKWIKPQFEVAEAERLKVEG